jgi:probable F420-dependent oxidoreductase
VPDHIALGTDTSGYPYGPYPELPTAPYPEPLIMLAAVAARTTRIELAPSTLIAPLRPAILLAKACATLDGLSEGRLVLGVGAGWHEDEFSAAGVPFAARGKRMDDTMRACRTLWRDSPASFSSNTVSFDQVCCEPRPVAPERIRILVGGRDANRAASRILDYAQGWLPPPVLSAAELADGVQTIRERLSAAGRAGPVEVKYALPRGDGDIERAIGDAVPRLIAAGVTMVQVSVGAFVDSADAVPGFLELLAERFSPYRGG